MILGKGAVLITAGLLLAIACKKSDDDAKKTAGPNTWTLNGTVYTAAKVDRQTAPGGHNYGALNAYSKANDTLVNGIPPAGSVSFVFTPFPTESGSVRAAGIYSPLTIFATDASGMLYGGPFNFNPVDVGVSVSNSKLTVTVPELHLYSNDDSVVFFCNAVAEQ